MSYVVDGEIVAFDGDQASFSALQPRIHLSDPRRIARSSVKVWFYVFDLLHYDGHDARSLRLIDRKQLLAEITGWADPLVYVDHVTERGEDLYRHAVEAGWEGIIAKHADARYRSGRSGDWLKMKAVREQEFVVGGYAPPQGSRAHLGAQLVGYYDTAGGLRYAGSVGTGYSRSELARLHAELDRHAADKSPFVDAPRITPRPDWVEPEIVVQVGYGEWTHSGHLRHPTYRGQRIDKTPTDVVYE